MQGPTITKPKTADEIRTELEELRAKKAAKKAAAPGKRDWYGLIYCSGSGWCSIADFDESGQVKPMWLGKTDEFIPYLRRRNIAGENITTTLAALEDFRAEKEQGDFAEPTESKSHSGHLATKNLQHHITVGGEKSIVATLKQNPQLLGLLRAMVGQDLGVRTIHTQLVGKGYKIPQRTVTRWVSRLRSSELL